MFTCRCGRVAPSLWTEAVNTAVYLLNRLPITNKKGSIPFCLWIGAEPSALNLDNLRVFGCAAYATLDSSLRDGKFAPTSISGVFVGYDSNRKAYRIFHPASKKIFASCQVKFDEFVFPLEHTKDTVSTHSFATSTIGGAPTYPSPSAVVPHSNQSTASISESHLVSHSDFPYCEWENPDMVLADPLVDSVTQQLPHSTSQLQSNHDDLMSLQKMNSELTAQNSRLRNRAHHLAQLVPSPTARNKRTHASTHLLPPIVPNELLVDSRPTKLLI